MRRQQSILLAAAILILGGLFSTLLADYGLRLLNIAVISAIAVIGFNFAFGLTGLISLGHAAFFGFGAYSLAILTTAHNWSHWTAIPVGILLTVFFAAVLGYPLLRLKGHYLALATLGVNVSFTIVATNWIGLTGGTNGISGIPDLSIAGFELHTERRFLWFGLLMLACCATLAVFLTKSRFGRAMIAVRDDETAAVMIGIDVTKVKVSAFCLSAAYAAIAGSLFATHVQFIAPEDFSVAHSITFLAMLIIGGEGKVVGAIVGALLLTFMPEWLRFLGEAYLAFFGMFLLIILIFLPTGLVGLGARMRPYLTRSRIRQGRFLRSKEKAQ